MMMILSFFVSLRLIEILLATIHESHAFHLGSRISNLVPKNHQSTTKVILIKQQLRRRSTSLLMDIAHSCPNETTNRYITFPIQVGNLKNGNGDQLRAQDMIVLQSVADDMTTCPTVNNSWMHYSLLSSSRHVIQTARYHLRKSN